MTDTAKPTPGPWHVVRKTGHNGIDEVRVYSSDMGLPIAIVNSNWPRPDADAALIAEAGTVFHETVLTPRQLLDRVKELEADRDDFCDKVRGLFSDPDDGEHSRIDLAIRLLEQCGGDRVEKVWAALAKCRKVGVE